ncbi:hypothetical protein AB1Y20_000944 [Prymnesium parvum]|uniref:Uncharacterized protein n=1 Tax=Prymnesium parvum TaxID=97485 RepID=A0AB34KBW7_PRYPA
MGAARESKEDIEARVSFELTLKQVKGNYRSIHAISFKGVQLCRKPEWIPQLVEALKENDTCTELDLSGTEVTDAGVQQLAVALCTVATAPKLVRINLCDNALSPVSETVLRGLSRLRPKLEVSLGSGPLADGFVCEKRLIEGLSAWPADELRVPNSNDFWCPEEISGRGKERVVLTKGFSGANGTKYKCDLAVFEQYNTTGNFVLLELKSAKADPSAGTLV